MLRTDVCLLQAAFREPFLWDETNAQDQPKKSFFGDLCLKPYIVGIVIVTVLL